MTSLTHEAAAKSLIDRSFSAGHACGKVAAAMQIHASLVDAGEIAASSLVLRMWHEYRDKAEAASKARDEAMVAGEVSHG